MNISITVEYSKQNNRYIPCKNKKAFNEVFSEINAKTCVK
jgi:hypothetical protein